MANEKRLICLDEAMQATHKEIWWTESQQAAVRSFLVKLPRVDAVEVVHAQWLYDSGSERNFCSACDMYAIEQLHRDWDGSEYYKEYLTNYCPNCGAGMR